MQTKTTKGSENMNSQKKKLNDAIKGMYVRNWEIREDSSGRRVVYVRFHQKPETGKFVIEG